MATRIVPVGGNTWFLNGCYLKKTGPYWGGLSQTENSAQKKSASHECESLDGAA